MKKKLISELPGSFTFKVHLDSKPFPTDKELFEQLNQEHGKLAIERKRLIDQLKTRSKLSDEQELLALSRRIRNIREEKRWLPPPAIERNDGYELAKQIINPVTGLNLNETLIQSKMNPVSPTKNIERLIEARESLKVELFREAFKFDEQTEQKLKEWEIAYYKREKSIFENHLTEPIFEGYVITAYNGYIKFCETQINRLNDRGKDWKKSHEGLIKARYIKECSLDEFNAVMNYHRPLTNKRITWLKSKSDAVVFMDITGLNMPDIKACFVGKDGTPLHLHPHNRPNPKAKRSHIKLRKILEQ